MDRPAANKDVNWIKRGQHSVRVTTFTSGGASHNTDSSSTVSKRNEDYAHDGAVYLKVQREPVSESSKRINIPVVNVISKPEDNVSSQRVDIFRSAVSPFIKEGECVEVSVRSRSRATSEPPVANKARVIPICLQGSSNLGSGEKSNAGSRSKSSTESAQVQGKQKVYTSGVYQECAPVRPSSEPRSRSSYSSVARPRSCDLSTESLKSNIGSPPIIVSSRPFSLSPTTVELEISPYGSLPSSRSSSNNYTGVVNYTKEGERGSGKIKDQDKMHGGGLHTTDQRSATFVSSISVRDAAKPPPIPPSMLSSAHVSHEGLEGSINWHQNSMGRMITSPVGISVPTHPASEQRNVIISGQRYPAPDAALVNTRGGNSGHIANNPAQTRQINVQYQTMYQSTGPSGYSSPRSSIGSGGGDSIASSPRSSLANAAALYEQRRFGGSPRSSLALANPTAPNRPGWTVQMVEASTTRQLSGSPHDQRIASSSSISSHSVVNLGPRNNNVPLQLLADTRFSDPSPPPHPAHIYTDPRQRTLPAQPQTAVSVRTSAHAGNSALSHNSSGETRTFHNLQNGALVSSVASSVSAPSPPPVLPARVPLNYKTVAQQHLLNRQSEPDAEMAVAALTQQLERDMTLTSSSKKPDPSPSPPEPPPPYHGPHDVQTSVKHALVTPNQVQTSSPSSQTGKPNVRLVAPVQGIQIQPPTSSGAAPASQTRSGILSPGGLKSQLAFQVTPPKSSGPSDAERKLAALTQQLEDEMDHQSSGDYFGQCVTCGDKVTGANEACQAMGNLYHTKCFVCCSCAASSRALPSAFIKGVKGRGGAFGEEGNGVGRNGAMEMLKRIATKGGVSFRGTIEQCSG
ncbi:Wilms tumor protein 1-interacting-like protein [Plakobranchus ocellatus]|uniref:Wilms tumor protein 1-interacting-like protein n=1 Tax=Plakobranchus ocellatus TaxID=259542 RepID=A0AAV4CBG9_9GAST|nr:Wilms tumor protein 1-interacting-like protein [Plakobranchus ocellatus]